MDVRRRVRGGSYVSEVSNRVNRRFASFPIYFFLIGRKITSHHF